jgi:hypothetical protein
MINGKKTKREKKMEKRTEKLGEWEAKVVNIQALTDEGKVRAVTITTPYSSEKGDTLDSITHKIKLDLMTNLKYGFESPIKVAIRKQKKGGGIIADEMNAIEK